MNLEQIKLAAMHEQLGNKSAEEWAEKIKKCIKILPGNVGCIDIPEPIFLAVERLCDSYGYPIYAITTSSGMVECSIARTYTSLYNLERSR